MTILLDTSILIDLQRKEKRTLETISKIVETDPTPASISFMNYFEFIHGLELKSPKNKDKSIEFIEKFHFLQPTKRTAHILSNLKYKYEKRGRYFSLSDLFIASQTIENNMTLVTKDRHFEKIDELEKIIV